MLRDVSRVTGRRLSFERLVRLASTLVNDAETAVALAGTGLRLTHGDREILSDADIALRPGRVTVLLGPNGSGKSTLLRTLARLHPAAAGTVTLDDGRVDAPGLHRKEFARRLALLAQSRPSPSGVTVRDVVGYGRYPHQRRFTGATVADRAAVDSAMSRTGVRRLADRAVGEISGGELQRVWLASCLAQETALLLLDEPTTFLDLRYQVEFLDLVRDLADDGVAVGIVLHDLDQAAEVADDVVLLHEGRVRAAGAPVEVLTAEILSAVYGIAIDVVVDDRGRVHTRPRGRHRDRPRRSRTSALPGVDALKKKESV